MRRLLKKLLIFILPFLLLGLFFFGFETYDYFGLKHERLYQTQPLASMRRAMNERPSKIILGDSRMANLNEEYVRELSGEDYVKLAYGGAQIGESIDLFWYAAEYCDLEKVVFGVNFYTSGGAQTGEEKVMHVENAKPIAGNPFLFMMNMNYWLESMAHAKNSLLNPVFERMGRADLMSVREDPARLVEIPPEALAEQTATAVGLGYGVKWKPYMEYYASEMIYPVMRGFEFRQQTKDALAEIIGYCAANGIELVFVFPPIHEVIYENVIWRIDEEIRLENAANPEQPPKPTMTEKLRDMKDFLIERATVYDLEVRSAFTSGADSFLDGFHMQLEGKMLFARLLFTATEEHPEMIEKHIRDGVVIA